MRLENKMRYNPRNKIKKVDFKELVEMFAFFEIKIVIKVMCKSAYKNTITLKVFRMCMNIGLRL
jgi:hypothetical protein